MLQYSLLLVYCLFSFIGCQQLQWYLVADGTGMDSPMPRRDAALGYDSQFLILYGGRDQAGMPLQDTYAFNIATGQWERLDFPNAPSSRYGMASANSLGNGLYIFGGFGMQGSSQNYNPYMAYGSSGLPFYKQSPVASNKQKLAGTGKQNYNQMNPSGNNNYNNNDDRADENFQPLQDGWFLNYATKSWQSFQSFQYARGFGSAAVSPFSTGGVPRVIYTMGKSHDWMYSTVESTGQAASGFNQQSSGQSAIIMYDLSSYNPSYPHARYGHSTTLLTDNHLLLYGGCLSGYGKGGPCPSTDTWLLHIDRGHWERLWECPTTKMGAAMVTLPSSDLCASMGQGMYPLAPGMNTGNEPPVAVLWGGREKNPSSIRTYPSPENEVAVFSLSQKEWFLKRALPSQTGGRYPTPREGSAYVAGCLDSMPGMFVFGGRSVTDDRRVLSDLWFLHASPQSALGTPNERRCIYPFSYYHLHGMLQFFAYGVFFPIGYLVGVHMRPSSGKRLLHSVLQGIGVAAAICGFSIGVHSVRAAHWLHFKHAHAIIGIITFILTMIQFFIGLVGCLFLSRGSTTHKKMEGQTWHDDTWSGAKGWRLAHHLMGALIVALGIVNISLGVFLAILPLAVWIIWYIYMGFLILILVGMEIVNLLRSMGSHKPKPSKISEVREDPKGTSRVSVTHNDDEIHIKPTAAQRQPSRPVPPLEPASYGNSLNRRTHAGEDMAPLITHPRQPRAGDVTGAGSLPEYNRPMERDYPVAPRKRSGPAESDGFDYYVGYAPANNQSLPRPPVQQQNQHNVTRIRLH